MFDEPKDMFAGVDEAPKAPSVQPPSANPTSASIAPPPSSTQVFSDAHVAAVQEGSSLRGKSRKGVILAALFLAFLVVAAIGVGFWYYQQALQNSLVTENAADSTQVSAPASDLPDAGKGTAPVAPVAPLAPAQPVLIDGDGDGLSDARETELGTSLVNNDTDGDGLGDREEVDVYGTDPLRPDTDSDTFTDGSEVANGYNPNGPGRLLQIPSIPATP